MKKKNILTAALSLALVAVIAVGATQVGGVKDPDGNIAYGTETPIMPGDVISKQVSVSVDGESEPAWVALKLTVDATPGAESTMSKEDAIAKVQALIDAEVDPDKWVKGEGGVYYYQSIVETGDTAEHIFDTLTLVGTDWDNDQANMTFSIAVEAYAVRLLCDL